MLALIAGVWLLSPASASAAFNDDTLVEGAKLCTRYLPRHERQYGIPVHLLAAIASTESGRFHKALGLNLPWPWTINVEGKGYFYDTKQEAIDAVRKLQARGFQSIDVGCMQVNLFHHPFAFASLDQAFDPAYNVAYAAQFLKKNFEDEGSWRKATADYHSRTPMYGEQYAQLVFGAWSRIINKVADARAGRPILNVASSKHPNHYHDTATADATESLIHRTRYHAPHMHEISVSSASETSEERGVMVIRPQHDSEPAQQQASAQDAFITGKLSEASSSGLAPASPPNVTLASASSADIAAENKNAQIVKIRGGRVVSSRGQFTPDSHLIRISDTSSQPSAESKSPFVFNN